MSRCVEIELGGKTRKLRYDFNALADIEDKAKVGIGALLSGERIGFSTIRLLLWGGLKHENRGLTIDVTGGMVQKYIDEGGNTEELLEKVINALELSGVMGKPKGKTQTEAAI